MESFNYFLGLAWFSGMAVGCAMLGIYGMDNNMPLLDKGMVFPFVVTLILAFVCLVKFTVAVFNYK